MLRQIGRLTRPVPSMGPRAIAVSVYGDASGNHVAAREAGFEGVACVDDAARALELYCALWVATRLPWVLQRCEGLLEFVLHMQDEDGRWVNFILDWDGDRNREGRTSRAGGHFWQARALLALARASRCLDDARVADALRRGLPHLESGAVPSDVRVLHILTAMELAGAAAYTRLGELLEGWVDEVASCRIDGMLMNAVEERGRPHLWGHIQEGVLAEAALRLGRDDLIQVAAVSADLVIAGVVESGFAMDRVQPYDVACCIDSLSRLGVVTRDPRHGELAHMGRAWFDGRNTAGVPVYDRDAGRVADGIDEGRISAGSGAEANIVAGQSLFEETVRLASSMT